MAAARSPGPADARVPCPLCGGLIHPIAGRCKHCKEDLSAQRSARPAAAAALPPLQMAAPAHANGIGHAPHYAPAAAPPPVHPVHPANAHMAVPIAVAALHDGSQPILPPRPTGRMYAPKPAAAWKSWPVIVIILAVIAIVTAVVLMVWPPGADPNESAGKLAPPPAPERMNTDQLVTPPTPVVPGGGTQGGLDPWKAQPAPVPAPTPDIDDPDLDPNRGGSLRDPFSSIDPFANPRGRGGTGGGTFGGLGTTPATRMMSAVFHKACDKLTTCPNVDSMVLNMCRSLSTTLPRQDPPTCDEATRCLERIENMSCSTVDDTTALIELMTTIPDCTSAITC